MQYLPYALILASILSSATVPIIFVFIVQPSLECLRISFLYHNINIYDTIYCIIMSCSMIVGKLINAYIVSICMRDLFLFVSDRHRVPMYYKYNYYNNNITSLMFIIRFNTTLVLPVLFDLLAAMLFAYKSSIKYGYISVAFVVLQLLFMFIQLKLQYSYDVDSHKHIYKDIIHAPQLNLSYNLFSTHNKIISRSIDRDAYNYMLSVRSIYTMESLSTLFNCIVFSFSIYFLSNIVGSTDIDTNTKASVFAIFVNIYIGIWNLLKNFINIYDKYKSINLNFIYADAQDINDDRLSHQTDYSYPYLDIKYNNKLCRFKYGLNIIRGVPGSGKTTLVNLILSKYKHCIMMPQNDHIFKHMSVRDNIICSLKLDTKILKYALDVSTSYITNYIDRQCDFKMSGGEAKIISFLRLLYHVNYHSVHNQTKNIVILDEPFNQIDKVHIKRFVEKIEGMDKENNIIILIDHSQAEGINYQSANIINM